MAGWLVQRVGSSISWKDGVDEFEHYTIVVDAYVQDTRVQRHGERHETCLAVRDADAPVGNIRYRGQAVAAPNGSLVRCQILSGTRTRSELRLEEIAHRIEIIDAFENIVKSYP